MQLVHKNTAAGLRPLDPPLPAGLAADCALHALLALALLHLSRQRPRTFAAHREPLVAGCTWNGTRLLLRLGEGRWGAGCGHQGANDAPYCCG